MLASSMSFVSQNNIWASYLEKRKDDGESEELREFQLSQVLQYRLGIICSHAAEGCPAGRTEPPL